ncbi:MAG: hypothetical protein QOJ40_2007, partial [Verrucomicrobiota bacterium]
MKTALLALVVSAFLAPTLRADPPFGLDRRELDEQYLNNRFPTSAPNNDSVAGSLPTLLSQTGAFENTANLVPARAMIPYTVNMPLWSDGALKYRWLFVPKATITFSGTNWIFPEGSVLVKHFELNTGSGIRRLETRFVVVGPVGKIYAITYKWKTDNSDAYLLTDSPTPDDDKTGTMGPMAHNETISVSGVDQVWHWPTRAECVKCHNKVSNPGGTSGVLGLKTAQLNGTNLYPAINGSDAYNNPQGNPDNQLRTLDHVGLFDLHPNIATLAKMAKGLNDTGNFNRETIARSYLDANCAHCHLPGGTGQRTARGGFDAQFSTPFAKQDLTESGALKFNLPGQNPGLLANDASLARPPRPMPPVGKNVNDSSWTNFLRAWILNSFNAITASSTALNAVTVQFNGVPEASSTTAPANYNLVKEPAGAAYTLTLSAFNAAAKTVTFTAKQSTNAATGLDPGARYRIFVNNVRDQATPQNTVWPSGTEGFLGFEAFKPAVPGNFGDTGSAPPNDNFSAATVLSNSAASDTVFNCRASKESGEPDHADNPGGASVWWQWTAPANGLVSVDTAGSDFDTLLALYTGSSVSSLVLVSSNDGTDDPSFIDPHASQV